METASSSSCSILHGLSNLSSGRLSCRLSSRGHFYFRPTVASGSKPLVFPSHSSTLSANLTRRPNGLASQSACVATAFSSLSSEQQPAELGLLLEVEGVLIDAYRLGNRQAFNKAFQKLGLDCANWTQPIYLDLVRKSAGDEKRMLVLFFNRIGWPTSLPTNEKDKFIKSVLQEKKNAMGELMMSKDIPLRPGVEEFIDSACNEDIPVVILTSYGRSEEKVTRAVVEKLGEDRVSKIKVVGTAEVRQSLYGQLVLGNRLASGSDEEIVKEVRGAVSAEKQRIAEEVASMLKLKVELDTSSSESIQKVVAALHAGAEFAEIPLYQCVLVAGSQSGVGGAQQIGMSCVVLRSSLISRAEFPSAKAIMDGFGGADLTISRLRHIL